MNELPADAPEEVMRAARKNLQRAQDEYDMTPRGQEELLKVIQSTDAVPSAVRVECIIRLAEGQTRRRDALAALKESEQGDIDNHSDLENLIAEIPVDQDFPREQIVAVIRKHTQRFGEPLGEGRNRVVFDRGDGTVVKIPKNWDGVYDNAKEVEWEDEEVPLAPCRAVYMGKNQQVMAVVMEKVTPVEVGYAELPRWAQWVDCAQVGYTKSGKLVAYDL